MKHKTIILLCLSLCSCLHAQSFQLMTPERYQAALRLIPRVDDYEQINAKLKEAMLYTKQEMPPCFQYQTVREVNGRRIGDPVVSIFDTRFPLDSDPIGLLKPNENEQFPWEKSGGLERVPSSQAKTFFAWWLPTNPTGSTGDKWPMTFEPAKLQPDPTQPNISPPIGWKAKKPVGQLNADILVRIFRDGTQLPFEMRAFLQMQGDRDVQRYVPLSTFVEMQEWFANQGIVLPQPKWIKTSGTRTTFQAFSAGNFIPSTLQSVRHKSFVNRDTWIYCMPKIPMELAQEYLRDRARIGFEPMRSEPFATSPDGAKFCYGVIAADDDPDNWVPSRYLGAHAGADDLSCRNCHRDILRNVNSFGTPLTTHQVWVAGFADVHTINPFKLSSIGPPDTRRPELSPTLIEAGYIALHDSKKHPPSIYQVMKEFDPK